MLPPSPCKNCPDLVVVLNYKATHRSCQLKCQKLKQYRAILDKYDDFYSRRSAVDTSDESGYTVNYLTLSDE
jgi:hypothetical protein